jgi:hypothetical protein
MTTTTTLFRVLGTAAFVATLSACGTTPTVAPPTAVPKLQDMLTKASEAASAGQKEQAVTLWKQAAAAHPADKTPWGNIAKAKFDAAQYGEAIVNAQEVLVRDPNDKQASSIIATSGLRLATRALSDLSRQNGLSGSLQKESMELAKLLRESLGRDDLFVTTPPPAKIRVRDDDKVKPGNSGGSKAKTAKPAADECKASDPFCALK